MKLITQKKLSSHSLFKERLLFFQGAFKHAFVLSRNKRSNEKTLEEATQNGRFDYWLSQEDIADIARLEYHNFKPLNNLEMTDFEIIGSKEQLFTQIASFLLKIQQVAIARHTLIINLGSSHWVTLVFYHEQINTFAYFVNSLGEKLPGEYHSLFSNFDIKLIDLSQYFHSQQTDPYNCGLWALENAADLNKMLDEKLTFDWLIFRLGRPRTTHYFSERRQSLSKVLREDFERFRRLNVFNPTLAEKKTILGSRRPLEASPDLEPLPKKTRFLSQEEKLKLYLEVFVQEFMLNFVKRIGLYHLTAKENRISEESFRNELKTGTTGALIGYGIAQTFAGALPAMIASIRTLSSHYFTSKTKARKITRTLSNLAEKNLDQILSEAGVAIFKSYESQFMQITDKAGDRIAIEKLAEDAAARTLNYVAENQENNFLITTETITRGVIFGRSEKFFDPSFKNLRIRISGSRIQDKEGNSINSANLYEKTGLIIINPKDQSEKLYRGKPIDSTKYGYRQALDWEIEENDLRPDYKEVYFQELTIPTQENQFQYFSRKYQFLDYPKSSFIKQTAQDILQKIQLPSHSPPQVASISHKKKGPIHFNLGKPVENFSGRQEVLAQLHQLLIGKSIGVVTQLMSRLSVDLEAEETPTKVGLASVSGLGGMGKTQVALRYAQQYAAEYDNNVIWINAETKNDISLCLTHLANQLDINIKDSYSNIKNTNELIQEIYNFFNQEKSLFIFDNVENYREFSDLFPKSLAGNTPTLLITSRYSHWKNVAPVLSIDIFTEQETKNFIKKELSIGHNEQDNSIKELHILLQGLPLALQQAVTYITLQKNIQHHYSISEYINQFKEKSEECLNFDFFSYSNDPYVKTVFLTWQLTLDKIKQTPDIGEKAIEILNIMGYLHPDHIANTLFLSLEQPEKLGGAIHLLRAYSLINQQNQPDISTIHRLVQQVIRINLEKDSEGFRKTAEKIIKITQHYFKNKETELHFIYFLLYISQNDPLALSLNLGYTRRKILETLIYSTYDINIVTIYENARLIMNKENYYYFMGESIHYLLKRGLVVLLSETLNHLEKCLVEEILTLKDINLIIEHRYQTAVKFKGRWLVPSVIERARQLGALQLFFKFENKLFPQKKLCFSRKKREIIDHCNPSNRFAAKQITSHEFIKQLQLAGEIADFASLGLLSKDMLSELLQGRYNNVALTLSLIGGSRLVGGLSNQMRLHGQRITATEESLVTSHLNLNKPAFNLLFDEELPLPEKNLFLGNSLRMAAPFVAKSASFLSNTYYFYKEIQAYRQDNSKQELPTDLITSSLYLGIDGIQSGIDIAEDLKLIEEVSELSNPISEIAGVSIWISSEIKHVVQQEQSIEHYVHLDWMEKIWQGLRAIAHYQPSAYLETKAYNNKLVQLALSYLKNHTDIQAYIFPAAHSSKALEIDNLVFLKNKTRLTLSESMPDVWEQNKGASKLFCLSGVEESKFYDVVKKIFEPFYEVYQCKRAIGVEYKENRTRNIHLIALGEGNDRIESATVNPTIIHVNNGNKNYWGSDVGTLFILEGHDIKGIIQGGKEINIIKFESVLLGDQPSIPLIDSDGLICRTLSHHVCKQGGLEFIQIQRIFGIKNQQDIFYLSKKSIHYVDGFSGKNPLQRDHIYITDKAANNLEIILRANTVIHSLGNHNETTTILYRLTADQTGESWLHFNFSGAISHQVYIKFPFDALWDIVHYTEALSFHFFQPQASFNLTVCFPLQSTKQSQAEMLNQTYYIFPNNLQVRLFNQKNLHILENHRNLIENIRYYSSIAYQLKRTLSIHFGKNEILQIGYGKHAFISNDYQKRSHLLALGEQSVYRIIAGDQFYFPLPEIIVYKNNKQPLFANSLDVNDIWQQVKKVCPESDLSLSVDQFENDLIIILAVNYYLLGNECVRLENKWPIAKIKLSAACMDNWYQDLEIILANTSLTIAANENGQWYFEKYPLIFNSDKAIIVLTSENLEFQENIIVLKLLGLNPYHFYCHHQTDLFFLPQWQNNTQERLDDNIIVFSRFYQDAKMREKTLASTLHFLDREIVLNEHREEIAFAHKNCLNFSNITEKNRQKRDTSKVTTLTDSVTMPFMQYQNARVTNTIANKRVTYKTKKRPSKKKSNKKISYLDKNLIESPQKLTSEKISPLLPQSSNEVNPQTFYSIEDLASFNQPNNHSPSLFNTTLIDKTPLNLFNTFLLYTTLFKKPKKPAKTFINPKSEIDEIEQRVMKALKNNTFH